MLSFELISSVASFGRFRELRSIATTSRDCKRRADYAYGDKCTQSSLWEAEFKIKHPVLHSDIASGPHAQRGNTWRSRLRRVNELARTKIKSFQYVNLSNALPAKPIPSGFTIVDVVLHNHPVHGFRVKFGQVNIRGLRSTAVCGYHQSKKANSISSAENSLGPLTGSEGYALLVYSIDGSPVSKYYSLCELVRNSSDFEELTMFRLIRIPTRELIHRRLPPGSYFHDRGSLVCHV